MAIPQILPTISNNRRAMIVKPSSTLSNELRELRERFKGEDLAGPRDSILDLLSSIVSAPEVKGELLVVEKGDDGGHASEPELTLSTTEDHLSTLDPLPETNWVEDAVKTQTGLGPASEANETPELNPCCICSPPVALRACPVGSGMPEEDFWWIIDTGAGQDVLGKQMVADYNKRKLVKLKDTVPLDTAGGEVIANQVLPMFSKAVGENIFPLILPDTPPALSVGERCVERGFGFHWEPYEIAPTFIFPDGRKVTCHVESYVPYLREPEGTTVCPAVPTSVPAIPPPEVLPPSEDPGGGHAPESLEVPPPPAPLATDVEEEETLTPRGMARLKIEASSLRHQMTHLPKNKFCKHCRRAKMKRAQRRARKNKANPSPKPTEFGQQITADTLISGGKKMPLSVGHDGANAAVLIYDVGTRWREFCPAAEKDFEHALQSLLDFFGDGVKAQRMWCDNAKELKKAATHMVIPCDNSEPFCSENNAIAERQIGIVSDGTKTVLSAAGFGPELWPLAGKHFCTSCNIGMIGDLKPEDSSWYQRFGEVFPGLEIPLGALIDFRAPKNLKKKLARFGLNAIPGIFLGWHMLAGGRFSGRYNVAPLVECEKRISGNCKQRLHWYTVSEIDWDPSTPAEFPLLEFRERVTRRIHGAPDGFILNDLPEHEDDKTKDEPNLELSGSTEEAGGGGHAPPALSYGSSADGGPIQIIEPTETPGIIATGVDDCGGPNAPLASKAVDAPPVPPPPVSPTGINGPVKRKRKGKETDVQFIMRQYAKEDEKEPWADGTMWQSMWSKERKRAVEAYFEKYPDKKVEFERGMKAVAATPCASSVPLPPMPRRIVEFCCEEDSRIGEVANADCRVIRLTKRHDVGTRAGYRIALKAVKTKEACLLWGSMPCTGGTALSHVNLSKGGSTAAKVMAHRTEFEHIWHTFQKVARANHINGGKCAIEWPKNCTYWKIPEVQRLMKDLGLVFVECHGCAMGVVDSKGRPLKKPWYIATNDEMLRQSLASQRCPGCVHGSTNGAETRGTGSYTTQMAKIIHKGWHRSVIQSTRKYLPVMAATPEQVPAMPRKRLLAEHRDKLKSSSGYSILVARAVSRAEVKTNAKAFQSIKDEESKLLKRTAWDLKSVQPWAQVVARADKLRAKGVNIRLHRGRVFALCVEKGSELADGAEGKKFKGRIVFDGSDVVDENHNTAIFNELGSNPATLEASKAVDAYGLVKGHVIEQSDAEQAYTQAELGDTIPDPDHPSGKARVETWVVLPPELRPKEWANIKDPVCRLRVALYGHPDSGGYWERHCEKALISAGFTRLHENWNSLYYNEKLKTLLMVYVDDFKMSGPKENLKEAWAAIKKGIDLEDPTPVGRCLGCKHNEITVYPEGKPPARGLEYDMTDFMGQVIEAYQKCAGSYGSKLRPVDTPFHPILWANSPPSSAATPGDVEDEPTLPDWGEEEGVLAPCACAMLMKTLYGARLARWDLLKIVQLLASRVSKWTASCDKALHRLMCYINCTKDLVLCGYVGDTLEDLYLDQYADADWAGDKGDYRSTSGAVLFLSGPNTSFPLSAKCAKQTVTSYSTPESELVAANMALRLVALPALDLWEALLNRSVGLKFREDNQSARQIMLTGKNPTMKHMTRTHGISVSWLHEVIGMDNVELFYQETSGQRADIFTKVFKLAATWGDVCNLIQMSFKGTHGKYAFNGGSRTPGAVGHDARGKGKGSGGSGYQQSDTDVTKFPEGGANPVSSSKTKTNHNNKQVSCIQRFTVDTKTGIDGSRKHTNDQIDNVRVSKVHRLPCCIVRPKLRTTVVAMPSAPLTPDESFAPYVPPSPKEQGTLRAKSASVAAPAGAGGGGGHALPPRSASYRGGGGRAPPRHPPLVGFTGPKGYPRFKAVDRSRSRPPLPKYGVGPFIGMTIEEISELPASQRAQAMGECQARFDEMDPTGARLKVPEYTAEIARLRGEDGRAEREGRGQRDRSMSRDSSNQSARSGSRYGGSDRSYGARRRNDEDRDEYGNREPQEDSPGSRAFVHYIRYDAIRQHANLHDATGWIRYDTIASRNFNKLGMGDRPSQARVQQMSMFARYPRFLGATVSREAGIPEVFLVRSYTTPDFLPKHGQPVSDRPLFDERKVMTRVSLDAVPLFAVTLAAISESKHKVFSHRLAGSCCREGGRTSARTALACTAAATSMWTIMTTIS